eukprot:scaffold268258_cov30-Prasinocladus_malaysianus.AAC.1
MLLVNLTAYVFTGSTSGKYPWLDDSPIHGNIAVNNRGHNTEDLWPRIYNKPSVIPSQHLFWHSYVILPDLCHSCFSKQFAYCLADRSDAVCPFDTMVLAIHGSVSAT